MTTIEQKDHKYSIDDVKWQDLSEMGILKDEIELEGQLDTLLKGEVTDFLSMQLVLLGVDMDLYATLQLVGPADEPILEIISFSNAADGLEIEK